ncbi:glycosyltransferase [Thermus brevis]|uniref:glycosyltransferase n=1 Tax=Thermus brevis TaxID=2862456 RepID=UPI0031BBB19E
MGFLDGRRWLKEMLNLVAKHPGWSFDLAGFGPLAEELREQASRLPNVRFHGRVSYTKALEIEAKAHVLFALYDPSLPNHRYSSPNKLFEAMALGKPILVARGTGMDTLVEEEELGYVVDYVSPSDVEKALEEIASWGPEKRKAFAQRTQSLFKERYSWEEMARRLLKLYGEV